MLRPEDRESPRVYVAASLALTDPGPSAAGVYVVDSRGRLISHRAYYLGFAGAAEAGVRAAIAALRLCRQLDLARPEMVVDDRWLFHLLRGRVDLPAELAEYAPTWRDLRAATADLSTSLVKPEHNPARTVALAPLVKWLPERTRRAEGLSVRTIAEGVYEVASERQPELVYRVHFPPSAALAAGEHVGCECPDYRHRGIPCKHLLVVAQLTGGRERLFYPETAGGDAIPRGPSEVEAEPRED